eukprot:5317688-Amphidinium_carterae.1
MVGPVEPEECDDRGSPWKSNLLREKKTLGLAKYIGPASGAGHTGIRIKLSDSFPPPWEG